MSRFYPGYSEALAKVQRMDLPELLSLIDSLYGRDGLRYGDDVDAVRAEALRQLEQEWTDPAWTREWGPLIASVAAKLAGVR